MKITNKLNLPQAIYNAVSGDRHEPIDNRYSVTELLSSTREILLTRSHWNEITEDVADLIPAMFGTAVHKIFEESNESDTTEEKLITQVDDSTIVGKLDLYHDNMIEDYKTASVNKVIKQDFEDHRRQVVLYAWLKLRTQSIKCEKFRINYLMKDWSKVQAYTRAGYPGSAIYVYEGTIQDSDYIWADNYVKSKLKEIKGDVLPECSEEEKWYTGTKYALYKKEGDKKAYKVCDSMEEANANLVEGGFIEVREGENLKCKYYCKVNKYCDKYKS